jgi:uncharacterized phiE125 gp8 family phage protein
MIALRPVLVTPPVETPITVGDVKEQVRVDHDEEDGLIASHIAAATTYLDGPRGILGRCLVTQTWAQSFDQFPELMIRLPFPDVSVVVITYRDDADAVQTLAASSYRFGADARGAFVMLADGASWPATFARPDAVTVTMTTGYGAAADVPPTLRHAVKVLAAAMYERREGDMQGSPMFDAFVAPFRHQSI